MWSYLIEIDENLALPLSLSLPLESYLSNASNSVPCDERSIQTFSSSYFRTLESNLCT